MYTVHIHIVRTYVGPTTFTLHWLLCSRDRSKVCVPCSLGVEVEEYFKVSHRLRSTSSSTSTPREYVTHTLLLSQEHNSH